MLAVFFVNGIVVTLTVLIHYQMLYQISRLLPRMKIRHRFRILFGVFGALTAHTIEVWIYALAYFVMIHALGWGTLAGTVNSTLMDCAYFSFATFSTVGYGDVYPTDHLRFLSGLESLTGLVLITWTASFLYYEMQRYWDSL